MKKDVAFRCNVEILVRFDKKVVLAEVIDELTADASIVDWLKVLKQFMRQQTLAI